MHSEFLILEVGGHKKMSSHVVFFFLKVLALRNIHLVLNEYAYLIAASFKYSSC